jgi:hypothetical protein
VQLYSNGSELGGKLNCLLGHQVAQVCAVFQISSRVTQEIFHASNAPSMHLAYIQWFSLLLMVPDVNSGMYKITKSFKGGYRCADIVPISSFICSVHLLPQFGPVMPQHWDAFSVLDHCHTFFVNPFSDGYNYLLFA